MAAAEADVVAPEEVAVSVITPEELNPKKRMNRVLFATKKPPYRCGAKDCPNSYKTYKNVRSFSVHMLSHITPAEDFVTCGECASKFPNQSALKKHKSDSHAASEWPCSCGKIYKHRTSRLSHLQEMEKANAAPEDHVALPPKPIPE